MFRFKKKITFEEHRLYPIIDAMIPFYVQNQLLDLYPIGSNLRYKNFEVEATGCSSRADAALPLECRPL